MLNTEQALAVNCRERKILCLAGAGTGKSYTLLSRISRLVSEGVNPGQILALTFTNAAAAEMKHRYVRDNPETICPEFRTFHGFCYHLLAINPSIRKHLGYTELPTIASDTLINQIDLEVKSSCGIKLSNSQIADPTKLNMKDKFQYDLYLKAKDKVLKSRNLITFDILCYTICDMFVKDNELVQKYKKKYKYIFVDEFQDTDKRQYDFVKSFSDSDLFIVGDALQAIYAFRGADSSIIKALSTDPEWYTVKLYQNYRSTSQICEFANATSKYADPDYRIAIASNSQGDEVQERKMSSNYMQDMLNLAASASGSLAILVRTNSEVADICSQLSKHGISYDTSNKPMDYKSILMSAIDSDYMYSWLSSLLDKATALELLRVVSVKSAEAAQSASEFDKLEYLLTTYQNKPAIRNNANTVNAVKDILYDDSRMTFQKCADILQLFRIPPQIIVQSDMSSPQELVDYLMEVIDNVPTQFIYVGTIHSSKGLEYDSVVLLGVNGTSFKLYGEDNLNLYYVGITRAKSHLYIYSN